MSFQQAGRAGRVQGLLSPAHSLEQWPQSCKVLHQLADDEGEHCVKNDPLQPRLELLPAAGRHAGAYLVMLIRQ